jgi:hypothetical protein
MTTPSVRFTLPDLRSFLPSVVRTVVPLLVGYFTAWPVAGLLGLREDQITSLITIVVTGLYYLLVRLAEQYVLPQAGWLLGYASAPVYVPPAEAGITPSPAGDVVRVVEANRPAAPVDGEVRTFE